jgi:high-affinity nickel-transport protein
LIAALAAINVAAWLALLAAAHRFPLLLPLGMTAYVLGLRHAVDADHIAAIDGTTRKLLYEGKSAGAVGFWFSLGHSTIVFVLSMILAVFGSAMQVHFHALQAAGAIAGTGISALFLVVIAAANIVVLFEILRGERSPEAGLGGGLLMRFLHPALRTVKSSAAMYPVGVLFGLGFDTATEVALLGISAVSGAGGMPIAYILLLPWLFTAGMSLIDTAEGVAMLRAYGWANVRPERRRFYNLNMTVLTVAIALLVAGAEVAGMLGVRLSLSFPAVGYGVAAVLCINVAATTLLYRLKR